MRAFFKSFGIAAAAAMMATTTAANAQAAAVAAPASESVDGASDLHSGVDGTTLIEIGILAALVVIVLVATRGNDNGSSPASP